MPYHSEIQQKAIEDRNVPFEDKKDILRQKNKNMVYQLVKYLYNNHRDTSGNSSADSFWVTAVNRYCFPSPVAGLDIDVYPFSEAIEDEKAYEKLVSRLNYALIEIAEHNINSQKLRDNSKSIMLYPAEDVMIPAHETCLVTTDVSFKLKEGYQAKLSAGKALSKGNIEIMNPIIPSKFKDVIKISLENRSDDDYQLNKGELLGKLICQKIPFEKLEGTAGRKSSGNISDKSRKARFNKSIISPGLESQLKERGPRRMKLLLFAYALQMSLEETRALMQAADPGQPINIWNGYEVIVFYAISRKQHDVTLNDLDDLGMIMAGKQKSLKESAEDHMADTEVTWKSFESLAAMDKRASIREMRKLLDNIRSANKIASLKAKEELDSLFGYVMKNADRIFKGDYGIKCVPKDDEGREEFRKCRDALTEQFWPYYENQIQFKSRTEKDLYISLQEMRSLPTKKHLKAVDEGRQGVTRADLEFAFFLKFALDNPLSKYSEPEVKGIDDLIKQRFSDYRLKAERLLIRYHFEKASAGYRFDDLLMVCMQKEYPIKELHQIAGEFFYIARDDVQVYDI